MNKLKVELKEIQAYRTDSELFLALNLTIDDVNPLSYPEGDDFDIGELFLTMELDDEPRFVFTCDCGYAGCAGYFEGIEIKREDKLILWHDRDQECSFQFVATDYVEELRRLAMSLESWNEKVSTNHMKLRLLPDIIPTDGILKFAQKLIG